MPQIASFCVFQHLVDGETATGCFRYNLGRKHNLEISCVAIPMVFNVAFNRSIEGLVSASVRFPTVRFHGALGTPTPPQLQGTHTLKKVSTMEKVVAFVKNNLPSTHPLVGKGWPDLPRLVWELPDEVGMEGGEEEEGEEEAGEEDEA